MTRKVLSTARLFRKFLWREVSPKQSECFRLNLLFQSIMLSSLSFLTSSQHSKMYLFRWSISQIYTKLFFSYFRRQKCYDFPRIANWSCKHESSCWYDALYTTLVLVSVSSLFGPCIQADHHNRVEFKIESKLCVIRN